MNTSYKLNHSYQLYKPPRCYSSDPKDLTVLTGLVLTGLRTFIPHLQKNCFILTWTLYKLISEETACSNPLKNFKRVKKFLNVTKIKFYWIKCKTFLILLIFLWWVSHVLIHIFLVINVTRWGLVWSTLNYHSWLISGVER